MIMEKIGGKSHVPEKSESQREGDEEEEISYTASKRLLNKYTYNCFLLFYNLARALGIRLPDSPALQRGFYCPLSN